jgi:DeoR family glycerol-3-phosphate regulon repressor
MLSRSAPPLPRRLSVDERRAHIIESIKRFGAASVGRLADECGVTAQTIRRDLQELGSEGLIQKGHGTAFAGPGSVVFPYRERQIAQTELKRRLTARLSEFILPGSTIFVGLGTTFNSIHEIFKDRPQIILATNNLGVAYSCTFNTGVTLFLFGGYLRRNDTAILSATAGGLGNRFKFDIAIFGASAIDRDGDVLAYDPLEVEFTREVIRASRQVIFVAQAEKFAGRAPHVVANLRDAAVLISNCDPRATLADPAALDRVRVIVVDDTGP